MVNVQIHLQVWFISYNLLTKIGQGWEFAHRFSERIPRFLPKNEQMSDLLKKWAICSFAHFGEQPERFAHDRSFPLSDLSKSVLVTHFWWATWAIPSHRSFLVSNPSDLLTLLTKKGNERIAHFLNKKKRYKNNLLDFFSRNVLSESLICSFIMSELSELLTVADLSWATWVICSRSLICLEQPERFAHGRLFVLSDLNESFTVAHLIWAK